MKDFLKSNKAVHLSFLLDGLLVWGGFLSAYLQLRKITQPLVIHFTSLGIDTIGSTGDLLRIALLGTVMVGIDYVIVRELLTRDWFLARLTSGVALFLSILLFYAFLAILSAN